jgi:hypothetical protein
VCLNFYLNTHFNNYQIMLFSLGLFLTTWFVEILFWDKMFGNIYKYNYLLLIIVYLFYSIGMFGFFMGVPIFNPFLGIVAGVYISRRIHINKLGAKKDNKIVLCTLVFSTIVIILVCIGSAYFALRDPYTEANLEGMFGIHSFEVTSNMVKGLIVFGGTFLIGFQIIITSITIKFTHRIIGV